MLRQLGRFDEAANAYREALRLAPENHGTRSWLAYTLLRTGRFREALDSLGQIPSSFLAKDPAEDLWVGILRRVAHAGLEEGFEPRTPEDRAILARVLRCRGRYAEASRLFARAFREDPALARDLEASHRFTAVSTAVLAAVAQEGLSEEERAAFHDLARRWLLADLALRVEGNTRDDRTRVSWWLYYGGLRLVREDARLAALPESEGKAWEDLWRRVREFAEGE